ncbi:MAG: ATPase [Deltaproteobacteria bacterium]|nr:ATPase [Deltaproteobacteria bacterium]
MSEQPAFYETVRQNAARRWDQLEQDPELAGPWHQLFKQVQSPRHILSELLQNADDAGATEAFVRIEDETFVFEHNGEDFSEQHFASLCRFGYSNKRTLHTIGFRGIGFKSTFSLGDCVKLFTPSLSVCFYRGRFTEPHWLSERVDTVGRTRVVVEIVDRHRHREVEKNLDEWLKSPVSLLFFNSIRRMQIGDREMHWGSLGPGPITDSEWMALYEDQDEAYLLVRSDAEAFPDEASEEIRQERILGTEEETGFPPCKIEIVLGVKGRLYVVLPTGIETVLPFACNAPFIQDPARLKIKDPETSPTNRWLLQRAGTLAAAAMLRWLGQTGMPTAERAGAYGLFPDVDRDDTSLEGVCSTTVEEAFEREIEGQSLLLTESGTLTPEKQSIAIPKRLFDIWPAEQAAAILDNEGRPALCRHIELTDRKKLLHWGIVNEVDKQKLLETLRAKHLPRPATWRQLLNLWTYVAPEIIGYRHYVNEEEVRIVPAQGKDVLYASGEIVRLGEKKLLQSENDWEFLAEHLIVLNQNWPRFLAEQRRTASEHNDAAAAEAVEAAYAVLEKIGLAGTSDVNKVIDRVAAEFFSQDSVSSQACVQLAQIAAKLGASVSDRFKYATRNGRLRSSANGILFDEDGKLEELLPDAQREAQLLHQDYSKTFTSCSQEDWKKWIASGRTSLLTFVPLVEQRTNIHGRASIQQEAKRRGLHDELSYPYVTDEFVVEDWDFDKTYWRHWTASAREDERLWAKLAERVLGQRETYWIRARSARLLQVATTGNTKSMTSSPVLPSWALKLRGLPCLPDTRGFHRIPGELLRRTPETESLMDVEPFVHGLLDRETTRPLLDLIGVRSTPTGPDRLLDCLRALARAESPPVHEVEKWYSRLDQMLDSCSTEDSQRIRQSFQSEKLILTQNGAWEVTSAVFLASDEDDVPDAEIIRTSVNGLTLWRKLGVADRATAELAIEWLRSLPTDKVLEQGVARRVRSLLARYPMRIWEECGHWLSLAGEWTPVDGLCYSLTMQSLVPWRHLHQWVKQQTADLQRLPAEATGNPPFSRLPTLATHVEERFLRNPQLAGGAVTKDWLTVLGTELRRVELDTDDDTQRIRGLANNLARTRWRETPSLQIIPYIDGTPAGTPRQADVLWLDDTLYVDQLPKAKLARRVPEEIGRAFGRPDIKGALDYSFERSAQDVREYVEGNFKLCPASDAPEGVFEEIEPDPTEQLEEPAPAVGTGADQEPNELAGSQDQGAVAHEENDTQDIDTTEAEDEWNTNAIVEAEQPRPRQSPKPVKPDIIERYARSQGFGKDSENRFFHEDGSWIARAQGARFPWERRAASGDLVRYYWPKDHCLEREPLQLAADVWGLIERQPQFYALILTDIEDGPIEVTGSRLRAMRDEGEVTLYPATYRLVYAHERHA